MNKHELITMLPKYIQALHSDWILYFSEEKEIATQERKNLVLHDIKLIKQNIADLEKIIG